MCTEIPKGDVSAGSDLSIGDKHGKGKGETCRKKKNCGNGTRQAP
jgi:hypothetical protein